MPESMQHFTTILSFQPNISRASSWWSFAHSMALLKIFCILFYTHTHTHSHTHTHTNLSDKHNLSILTLRVKLLVTRTESLALCLVTFETKFEDWASAIDILRTWLECISQTKIIFVNNVSEKWKLIITHIFCSRRPLKIQENLVKLDSSKTSK